MWEDEGPAYVETKSPATRTQIVARFIVSGFLLACLVGMVVMGGLVETLKVGAIGLGLLLAFVVLIWAIHNV